MIRLELKGKFSTGFKFLIGGDLRQAICSKVNSQLLFIGYLSANAFDLAAGAWGVAPVFHEKSEIRASF